MRNKAYYRDVARRKALRKRRIDLERYPSNIIPYYDNLHEYSKGKIHCSCPLCSAKTRNKGNSKLKGMLPGINWKITDRRRVESMQDALQNFLIDNF